MNDYRPSRREFLRRAAALGVLIGTGPVLASCGSEPVQDSQQPAGNEGSEPETTELDCTDVSSLSEAEVQVRWRLEYVDESATPDRNCANCLYYVPPPMEGECGACEIMAGPVNPAGWCNSWLEGPL